jgi:ABC-type multidrug transport system ATPase subunit
LINCGTLQETKVALCSKINNSHEMILQTNNLTRRFGKVQALDRVNLSVEKGQIRGLLGPNGAGKTTALRMICGVLTPNSGDIHIDGVDLLRDPVKAKTVVGYLPEGAPLPGELRAVDYLSYIGRSYGMARHTRNRSIEEWSNRCDIANVLHQTIGTMSRGYRQRVGLAASLLHKPKLIILDEPSSGLDPEQSISFRELVIEVASDAAVLYSSHNLAEVEATCDVVSVLCNGRIVADGTFESLGVGGSSVSIEVSPHTVISAIPTTSSSAIDENWMRCVCEDIAREKIAKIISDKGGLIRLIQPIGETPEATYLRLIQESQVRS